MANSSYPLEFKVKAVADYRSDPDNSYRKIADKYKISDGTLNRWDKNQQVIEALEKMKEEISPGTTLVGEVGFKPHKNIDLDAGSLKDKQDEEFCRLFMYGANQFNAFHAYCGAYQYEPIDSKDCQRIARLAQELLSRPDISIRISQLNELILTTKELADAQLAFLIMQNQDLKVKVRSLEIWYSMNGYMDKDEGTSDKTPKEEYDRLLNELIEG